MPQRMSVRRIATPELQGDDSYVVVSTITLGDAREWQKASKRKDFDVIQFASGIIAERIVDWNWVDDEGNPLPLPRKLEHDARLALIASLTDDELTLLMDAVQGPTKTEAKN